MINYWRPIVISVFVGVIISTDGRPAENAESVEIPSKSDSLQILEFTPLQTENDRKDIFGKKIFYNVSHSGLHIPVQVIYDSPIEELHKSDEKVEFPMPDSISPARRNSKQRNFPDLDTIKDNLKKYYLEDELADELVPKPSANATPFSLVLNGPEYKRANSTKKKIPIILHLFPPKSETWVDKNDTKEHVEHKYIVPILDKLNELNNKNSVYHNRINVPQSYKKLPTSYFYSNPNPAFSYYPPAIPYQPYPVSPYYLPYELQRQWASPFNNYFPIVIRDPFQSVLNYFSDLVEYGPAADVCQRKLHAENPFFVPMRTRRTLELTSSEPSTEVNAPMVFGKRRYDNNNDDDDDDDNKNNNNNGDQSAIEYVETWRQKRDLRKKEKDDRKYVLSKRKDIQLDDKKLFESKQVDAQANRSPDVGPQISKLIVRRGGVAIAGAGGIATAGSGGTAIVGPGGTAFTTPASSGGVAMVGPGGKVVKVPDLTSVLYGRTNSIAATGAGHATFTNKEGEVFTTSDNTGGVALVNPGGGVMGVSDDENFEHSSKTRETREVQLPPGARLLTTGPIIYYNPVYPGRQLRR